MISSRSPTTPKPPPAKCSTPCAVCRPSTSWSWRTGSSSPRTRTGRSSSIQSFSPTGAGAAGGALWGGLIGLIFLAPLLGAAIGAAAGGAAGALTDVGVDDKFMKELGQKLEPGGAALIVLVRRSTPDKVLPEIQKYGGHVLQSSLSTEAEERLEAALAHREAAASS